MIFHDNPNLFNPETLKTDQVLILGVSYKLSHHDSVDGVGVLADRFLVSQDVLEFWNPELTTDILVDTVFGSGGSEINVEILLRRNMLQAEAISIPLPWLHGESWVGAVPESCSSVKRVWTLGGCQVPDEACRIRSTLRVKSSVESIVIFIVGCSWGRCGGGGRGTPCIGRGKGSSGVYWWSWRGFCNGQL